MGQLRGKIRRQRFLRDVKTASGGRLRSKPPAAGQEYLDLYTLKRDRARWDCVKERAEQMIANIDKALAKIELAVADNQSEPSGTPGVVSTIDMKTRSRRNVCS